MLKTMCLPEKAMPLIVDSAIIKHTLENDNVGTHDLSRFHKLIHYLNVNEIAFKDFATCCREHLTHEKLSRSPMHLLFRGKINTLVIN